MSSLFIPGMNKPERCSMCPAYHLIEVPKAWLDPDPTFQVKPFCALTQEDIKDIRNINRNCPLEEIPTPHGRLIDKDELLSHLKKDPLFDLVERYGVSGVIESRPTILEAEE